MYLGRRTEFISNVVIFIKLYDIHILKLFFFKSIRIFTRTLQQEAHGPHW